MSKKLRNGLIAGGIILVVLIVLYNLSFGTYNKIVTYDENVSSAWSQVENQYQRRMDLIPNLVETVKGYASHEESLLSEIAEARSRAGGTVEITSDFLEDEEKFAEYQRVQDSLGSSLQRLLAVTENYPDLKANENFLALQDEIAGTENRISTERRRYNEAVESYNRFIRRFPNNIVASVSSFKTKSYFTASRGADVAPVVQF